MRILLKIENKINRWKRKLFGRNRVHHYVLKDVLDELLNQAESPLVLLETGCIRNLNEGTDSTYIISSTVKDKGNFYTFELEPEHIAICKELCSDYNQYINYVQGDSVAGMKRLVGSGELKSIDFAFLDSVNDGDHIWNEFKVIEDYMKEGSYLIVDDVLWADKGRIILPFLKGSEQWDVKVYNMENGMAVAKRIRT